MKHRLATSVSAILVLLGASIIVVGCGSGDDSSSGERLVSTSSKGAASAGGRCMEPPGDAAGKWSSEPPMTVKRTDRPTAMLKTSKGMIEIQLRPDEGLHAVNNFVFLAEQKFYTCIPIHRIIKGFMIQMGDPTGTGSGGPGYTIKDDPTTSKYPVGTVAMANTGSPDTGGSQFFIMHGTDVPLPPSYSVFGHVTKGQDVVDAIANVAVGGAEQSTPLDDVWLEWVSVS